MTDFNIGRAASSLHNSFHKRKAVGHERRLSLQLIYGGSEGFNSLVNVFLCVG